MSKRPNLQSGIHYFNPLCIKIANQLTACLLMEFSPIGFLKAVVSVGTHSFL